MDCMIPHIAFNDIDQTLRELGTGPSENLEQSRQES